MRQLATANFYALLLTLGIAPVVEISPTLMLRPIDFLLVIFAFLMVTVWLTEKERPDISSSLLLVLTIFTAWTLSSLISSEFLAASGRRIGRVGLLLIFVFGIQTLQPSLKRIAQCLSLHLILQSIIAIAQFYKQDAVGFAWIGEVALGENVLRVGDQIILRAQGLTEHPNLLAILLITCLFVCLAGFERTTMTQSLSLMGIMLMAMAALSLTFSRGAILGGAVAVVFLLTQTLKQIKWMIVLLPFALLLIFLFRDVWLTRLTIDSTLELMSIGERIEQNRVGLAMLRDHPLLGVGARNAQFRFGDYYAGGISRVIHSTVVLISAELGLIGGILWLIILTYPPIYTLRHREILTEPQIFLTAALIPYLVVDWTSPAAWDAPVGSLLRWLLLGLWILAFQEIRNSVEPSQTLTT